MYLEFEDIADHISFCLNVILKEAREEHRLIKQIFYTMLSAYTNNPINLAINSPSGEGKTYVLKMVGEKFPKEDVMFLAGMTEKALFHRPGVLFIKNESGEFEAIDDKIAAIDSEIQDKESEILVTKDQNIKQALRGLVQDLEKQKKDLLKDAKKLIDLSHKILIFLDTPKAELFNALMPLLSHDKYEVEYEYVDTHNGIKTKGNVIRGWPAVIFAQAIDYSHHARYPEIQRRFIITNPKMTSEKYSSAIDLIGIKFGLPHFAYQGKVVSDSDKEKVIEIIKGIRQRIQEVCDRIEPGKNNVFIPFSDILTKSLPKEKAFDMTVANRFFGYLSLLPLINIDKRPKIIMRRKGDHLVQTIPFALFEDLIESIYLMEYANGVRPYILEWYNEIFLSAYNSKTTVDSKEKGGKLMVEKRIAVTTEELVKKTLEVYNKKLSTKQILQVYIIPLINENYIDLVDSEIDRRAHIYYPILSSTKYNKLFLLKEGNNILQKLKIHIEDFTLYPDKSYLTSKTEQVLGYSSDEDFIEIKSHEGNKITIQELADQYYNNPEEYFELQYNNSSDEDKDSGKSTDDNSDFCEARSLSTGSLAEVNDNIIKENDSNNELNTISDRNNNDEISKEEGQTIEKEENNNPSKQTLSDDYIHNHEINNEYHEKLRKDIKNIKLEQNQPNKLFPLEERNNFLYSCYYCNIFETNIKIDYERHIVCHHSGKLCYPSKADLERLMIEGKGKPWEI